MDIKKLELKALNMRKEALKLVYTAQTGHIGGTLSSIDYLVSLYYTQMNINPIDPQWEDRDRFILSKGHCVEGYLCILADLGFFPKEELKTFSQFGTRLIGHPNRNVPGIDMSTGALGHGLSGACGMALAAKMDGGKQNIYTLLGDGELAEGSVWEAAMFAGNYKLDGLYAAIDRNHLQISGNTESIMKLEPLKEKFESFGFEVVTINGHDMNELIKAFDQLKKTQGKPKLMLLDTIKGKGVSFMENKAEWHHGTLTEQQYMQAVNELDRAEKELSI